MHRAAVLALLAGALAALLAWATGRMLPVHLPGAGEARLPCVSYAPFRRAGHSPFDPALRVAPAEIEADLRLLATKTRCVRTYGLDHGIDAVPAIARKLGLRVILGAWIGRDPVANEIQLERAIALARSHGDVIDLLVVGNEVLLRRELAPQALAALLGRAREASPVPVAYADVWEFWLRHAPELRGHVDVVVAHILPYWEDRPVPVGAAVDHVHEIAMQLDAAFAPLPVMIGETGWPAVGRQRGPAAPGTLEQNRFVRELLARQAVRPLSFNLIEGFDQPWKRALEGAMGGAWGVFDAGGSPRVTLAGPVVPDPQARWILFGAGFGAAAGLAALALARVRREALAWRGATLALAGALAGALGVVQWQALVVWCRSPLEWTLGGLTAALAALCSIGAAWRLAGAQDPARPARTGIAAALRADSRRSHVGTWILFAWLFAVAAMALGLVFDPRYRPLEWWNLAGGAALLLALALVRDDLAAGAREERMLAAVCALCAPVIALQEGVANTQALLVAGLLLISAMAVAWPRRRATAGAGAGAPGGGA
jgi:exo-beta-1,3-glucanase (GH17 family)